MSIGSWQSAFSFGPQPPASQDSCTDLQRCWWCALSLAWGESVAYPSYSKILTKYFPESQRGFANSLIASGLASGPAFGMLLGGILMARFGWRSFFHFSGRTDKPCVVRALAPMDAAWAGARYCGAERESTNHSRNLEATGRLGVRLSACSATPTHFIFSDCLAAILSGQGTPFFRWVQWRKLAAPSPSRKLCARSCAAALRTAGSLSGPVQPGCTSLS